MSETKSTYHQILKSTALFGGVQIFTILISIVRTKLIAIFIGPVGMGISGMLMSTLNLISGFSSLGLENSGIKFISESQNESVQLSKKIRVLRKILLISGFIGALLFFIFSAQLSQITFGSQNHSISFKWISLALLFKHLTIGELVVLQGMQKLKLLAKANLLGSLFGLLVSIPLYYYYKVDSIVPTILIASLFVMVLAYYFSRKIKIEEVEVSTSDMLTNGKEMLHLGLMMSLGSIFTLLTMYVLQIYISKNGGLTEVGYYNAGFTLLNSYVGIIFSSMATDYFPRLSAVNKNQFEVNEIVSKQALIAILIIAPIIVAFQVFTPMIVRLLFSEQFIIIVPMITLGVLGMLFRAVSWSIGYIILAKGESKLFVINSIFFNSVFLILHCFGYSIYGLKGLGIAFLIYYLFHFLVLQFIVKGRYQFHFNKEFYAVFFFSSLLCGFAYSINFISNIGFKYFFYALVMLVSVWFSLYQLNKKINLKELIDKFVSKFRSEKNIQQ